MHFLIPELFEKYFWKCGLPKFFLGHILSFSMDYWFDHQTGLLAQWHTTLKVTVLKIYIWVKYNNFKMGCNWAKKVVHELPILCPKIWDHISIIKFGWNSHFQLQNQRTCGTFLAQSQPEPWCCKHILMYVFITSYPNSQVKTISFLEQSLCCFLLLFERGRFVRGLANENNWRSSTDLSGQYFLGIAILR